ncbi:sensor domain-containing protein [Oceanobacillus sp. CAU 1775]
MSHSKGEISQMNKAANHAITAETMKNIEKALDKTTMILILDSNGRIQFANESFCNISNYSLEELLDESFEKIYTANNPEYSFDHVLEVIRTGDTWQGELKSQKQDGSYYWCDTTIVPFENEDGATYQYITFQKEITERKKYESLIKEMAYSDPLTKLPNRNRIKKWAEEQPKQIHKKITVMYIDLDRFKVINDNFSHDIGDKVLITTAERLQSSLQDCVDIFRIGGEEFVIILEDKEQDELKQLIDQVLEVIREPIPISNVELIMTASIGISSRNTAETEMNFFEIIEELIKEADTAMYHAKRNGGNQYHVSTKNQSLEMERNYKIELEIRNALSNDEYSLVYQPLINLKTHKIVGVESLLRWNNESIGNISPAEFIPILEKTRLIIPVGKWVLKTVCEQMKSWQEQGIFLQRVTVNVSPVQFRDPDFVVNLNEILNEAELDASYLEIEITEGTLIDIKDSAKKLGELQKLGVKVSIDDFGTGYSSLSYLKRLPIDTLKIDKSFIDDLDHDGEIIVNTIIDMGKNLQFRVIAEGIENMTQFKYLQQQECHEGQGYFFSRPVENSKIEELYHSLQ